jgi:hypothetical protein
LTGTSRTSRLRGLARVLIVAWGWAAGLVVSHTEVVAGDRAPWAPPLVEMTGGITGHLLAWERHERDGSWWTWCPGSRRPVTGACTRWCRSAPAACAHWSHPKPTSKDHDGYSAATGHSRPGYLMILCAGCAYGRRWHLAAGYTLGLGPERPIRFAGLARHAAIGLRLLPGQGLEVVVT